MFGVVREGKEASVEFFNKWVAEVKAHVPADRLLVFEAKQGWKPLCEFLNVPIPNRPYPRVNDTDSMKNNIQRLKIMSYTVLFGIPAIVSAAAAYYFVI